MSMFDPVQLRELSERKRLAAKRERVAAERRAGPSPMDTLEQAASETLARTARRPTSAAHDVSVDLSDVDVDLVGVAGLVDEHRQRLHESIEQGMMAGFGDVLGRMKPETRAALLARDDIDSATRRRFTDRARVAAELGRKPAERTTKVEPTPELHGEALIASAAADDLARLLAPKRMRRR